MYKQFRIISSEALGEEIDIILEELEIKEYFIVPDIKSKWDVKIKHMNNHIWPGVDEERIVILPIPQHKTLEDKLRELRTKVKEAVKLRVIITSIDDII